MFRDVALRDDIGGGRLAVDGARDRLFRGLIVVVLDLLIVLGVPMDEHADANEELSASPTGIMPSATLSATALATPRWAGPNIWTAWVAFLIVTLLNRIGRGLDEQIRSDHREQAW